MLETDINDASDVDHSKYDNDSAAVTIDAQDPDDAKIISSCPKSLRQMTVIDVVGPHLPVIKEMLQKIRSACQESPHSSAYIGA